LKLTGEKINRIEEKKHNLITQPKQKAKSKNTRSRGLDLMPPLTALGHAVSRKGRDHSTARADTTLSGTSRPPTGEHAGGI